MPANSPLQEEATSMSTGQQLIHALIGAVFGTITGAVVGGLFGLLLGYLMILGVYGGAFIGLIVGIVRSQRLALSAMVVRFDVFAILCALLWLCIGHSFSNMAIFGSGQIFLVTFGSLGLPALTRLIARRVAQINLPISILLSILTVLTGCLCFFSYARVLEINGATERQQKVKDEHDDQMSVQHEHAFKDILWRQSDFGILRYPHGRPQQPPDLMIDMFDRDEAALVIHTRDPYDKVLSYYDGILTDDLKPSSTASDTYAAVVAWEGANVEISVVEGTPASGCGIYFKTTDQTPTCQLRPSAAQQQAVLSQKHAAKLARFRALARGWRYPGTQLNSNPASDDYIELTSRDDPVRIASYYKRVAGMVYPRAAQCGEAWHGYRHGKDFNISLVIRPDDSSDGCGDKSVIEIF